MLKRLLLVCSLVACCCPLAAQADTRVVILGTGTPTPVADRSGPGVAVITNGQAYVFDAGGGMVKRAIEASEKMGIKELNPQDIDHLFLTHLHSDHIHDVSELATSRWWSRPQRLAIYGPKGLARYVQLTNEASKIEADIRAVGTPDELIVDREGYVATATEISDGLVFENADIRVEAFTVPHGDIRPAFGYKVTTSDKTIVISGDTSYSETLAQVAKGADILIHEVMSGDNLATQSEFWQQYHGASHTSATDVGRVASIAQPALVVLYHVLFFGASAEAIVAEANRSWPGKVVLANDLDIF
jgi:ribonuclease Z